MGGNVLGNEGQGGGGRNDHWPPCLSGVDLARCEFFEGVEHHSGESGIELMNTVLLSRIYVGSGVLLCRSRGGKGSMIAGTW